MNQIRENLVEQMEQIKARTITPREANCMNATVQSYLHTIGKEMAYAKLVGRQPKLDFMEENMTEKPTASLV